MMHSKFISLFQVIFLLCLVESAIGLEKESCPAHQLHREIILLNLVNSLYLTSSQINGLITQIQRAEEIRKTARQQQNDKESEIVHLLNEIKKYTTDEDEIPEMTKNRFYRANASVHQIHDQAETNLKKIEHEIIKLLNQNQILSVENFRPCIIPPTKDNIGQSVESRSEGIADMLKRIRKMPDEKYCILKDRLIERNITKIERLTGALTHEEKHQHMEKMESILKTVRNMNNKEFFIQKNLLAGELLPESDTSQRPHRKNSITKIGRFLMDPALLTILESKL